MSKFYPKFEALAGDSGVFFTLAAVPPFVNRSALLPGYASGKLQHLAVETVYVNDFSEDLTSRDDVVLAFLSLLLLLAVQAIISSILLSSSDEGYISNFCFSVSQVLNYVRELQPHRVFRSVKPHDVPRPAFSDSYVDSPPRPTDKPRLNPLVLLLAFTIIIFTFGVEVTVLSLTSKIELEVKNTRHTLRLHQPILPEWDNVNYHNRASFSRPCVDVTLVGVLQGKTRSNVCVATSVPGNSVQLFQKNEQPTELQIQTYLHEYGAQHHVTVGGITANLSSRVYFQLGDGRTRTMVRERKRDDEEEGIKLVHTQFVAFLFNAYNLYVQDNDMSLKRLNNDLNFTFERSTGGSPTVNTIGENITIVHPPKYTTTIKGIVPVGLPALRLSQHFFRAALAVATSGPNTTDLFTEKGMGSSEATVWTESVRRINWLTLTIVLMASLGFQTYIRYRCHPVTGVDIAGMWVKEAVVANLYRSPLAIGRLERPRFKIGLDPESSTEDWKPNNIAIFRPLREAG